MTINLADLSTSMYIASDDYAVGTVLPIVEIERIQMNDVPVPNSTKKQSKAVIFFKGATKGYVLTKNVGRRLGQVLAATKAIDQAWIGARIQLEVVGDVRRPDGNRGNAFRLRGAWPAGAPLPASAASTPTKEGGAA